MNMKLAENKILQKMNVVYQCMLFDLSKEKKSLFHTLLIGCLIGMVVAVPEGYSRFQVTGMIQGCFWV